MKSCLIWHWMWHDHIVYKSALCPVMTCCLRTPSHYCYQCCSISLMLYPTTRGGQGRMDCTNQHYIGLRNCARNYHLELYLKLPLAIVFDVISCNCIWNHHLQLYFKSSYAVVLEIFIYNHNWIYHLQLYLKLSFTVIIQFIICSCTWNNH